MSIVAMLTAFALFLSVECFSAKTFIIKKEISCSGTLLHRQPASSVIHCGILCLSNTVCKVSTFNGENNMCDLLEEAVTCETATASTSLNDTTEDTTEDTTGICNTVYYSPHITIQSVKVVTLQYSVLQ